MKPGPANFEFVVVPVQVHKTGASRYFLAWRMENDQRHFHANRLGNESFLYASPKGFFLAQVQDIVFPDAGFFGHLSKWGKQASF